jgi:DNA-binding MarR family transcriptional regulator
MNVADRIAAVRRFNRFYTQKIGVLDEGLLDSPFSLTEVRVLYELAHRDEPTAVELVRDLGLDPGYLSRILRRFEQRGLVDKHASSQDGRRNILRLTRRGLREFDLVNASTNDQIGSILSSLSPTEQARLLKALRTIEDLLDAAPTSAGRARRRRRAGAAHASTGK